MKNQYRALAFTGILFLAGCAATPNGDKAAQESEAKATAPREVPDSRRIPPQNAPREVPDARRSATPATLTDPKKEAVGMAFGRGIAKGPADMTVMFNANAYKDESVDGTFSYSASAEAGTIDIEAEIICVSLDNEAGRAWIGGRITRNDSTDPRFAGEPGNEAWMRAADRNADKKQPLVSGPLTAGDKIENASDYCNEKPWSEEGLYLVDPGALAIFP